METLAGIPVEAWETYKTKYPNEVKRAHDPVTKSNIMHNHMEEVATRIHLREPDLTYFTPYNGQHLIRVRTAPVLIRMKKLSTALTTSNIPTKIQKRLRRPDGDLFGFEIEHMVIVGYVPNKTWTDYVSIYLCERRGRALLWHIEFDKDLNIVADEPGVGDMFDQGDSLQKRPPRPDGRPEDVYRGRDDSLPKLRPRNKTGERKREDRGENDDEGSEPSNG